MIVATAFPPPGDLPPLAMSPDSLRQVCGGVTQAVSVPFANTDGRARSQALETVFPTLNTDIQFFNLSQGSRERTIAVS